MSASEDEFCGSSEGASGDTVFVANGDPRCIRPVGLRWSFAEDYVARFEVYAVASSHDDVDFVVGTSLKYLDSR